ncbi:MAG: class I SAM-dependent methyltransferase [Bacteroidales bacterium]
MEFDSKAESWDKDTVKIERAKKFAENIVISLPENDNLLAMEFGSGTGQVSLFLHKHFKHIYLVDNSEGMIKVLEKNIREKSISNMKAIHKNILEEDVNIDQLDVIYTLMTLHHIEEVDRILEIFNKLMKPGAYLFIGDLEKEDGSFHDHSQNFKGHHGFYKEELGSLLEAKGFRLMGYRNFFHLTKKFEDGSSKDFPLFFMAAKKK